MSDVVMSVADDMLRSYFERWQRLEEEKQTISEDLKQLFAEMKGNGFDTKAARAVFREQTGDVAARQEFDAICDLYRASLEGPRARPAHTHEKTLNNFASGRGVEVGVDTPHNPETGEITDNQELETVFSEPHERTPSVSGSFPDGGTLCEVSRESDATTPAESAANEISAPVSHSQASSSQPAISAGEGVPPPSFSPATPSDIGDIPASLDRRKRVEA